MLCGGESKYAFDREPRSIALSNSGDIYVAGGFQGTAVFGATTLVNTGEAGMNADIFIFKMRNE